MGYKTTSVVFSPLPANTRRCASRVSGLALRAAAEGIGVRRKTDTERLSEIINIRCTPSMKRALEEAACLSNLTVREIIRRKLRGVRIPNRDCAVFIAELRALRREAARQGGLIKHLYNVNPVSPEESAAALNKQTDTLFRISLFIERLEKEMERGKKK